MSLTMSFARDDVAAICDRLSADLDRVAQRTPAASGEIGQLQGQRPDPVMRPNAPAEASLRPGIPLARQYHYAAARLAVDHADRRLQQALATFVHSLDAPVARPGSLAEQLSRRLAQLREGAAPTPAAPRASPHQMTVEDRRDDRDAVRRAA